MAQKIQTTSIFFILIFVLICSTSVLYSAQKFDCSKYHNYKEVTQILKSFQSAYSNLAKLTSVGKSIQGKDLWLMEISNQKTGKADEKPAVFITGGIRGHEVVGTEVCLYTIKHLLEKYGKEKPVTELVDSRTFYIMPAMNPDGCDFSVNNPGKAVIKNFRKVDDDFDGKMNEDAAEDLNKDGFITMMRVKNKEGNFQISKTDPRIMLAKKKKNKNDTYKLYVEGIDNDNDEKYNEDGIGGVDLNHNFPSGWEMEYEQSGAGMYPGSEPESEAVMKFFISHPNITFVLAYASGAGALYRPFDHLADKEIPKLDLKVYESIGKKYKKLTGMELTHGFPEVSKKGRGTSGNGKQADPASKLLEELQMELPGEMKVEDILKMGNIRELVKSAEAQTYIQQAGISQATIKKLIRYQELKTKATPKQTRTAKSMKKGSAEFGTFLDWTYRDYNVYSFSPSLWTVPKEYKSKVDSSKKGIQEELAWFQFIDKEWGGKGFVPWKKYTHSQLGEVEIGGWSDFYKMNPPTGKRLEKVCEQNAKFAVELAEQTPAIKIKEIKINPIQVLSGVTKAKSLLTKDGAIKISTGTKKVVSKAVIAEVKIKVENVGKLGTRTAMGQKTRYSMQPARSVLATLEAKDKNIEVLSMPRVLRLGVIEGSETKDLIEETEKKETSGRRGGRQEQQQAKKQKKKKDKDEPNIKSGTWLVKIEGGSAELTFKVRSEKGGTAIKKVKVDL